MNKQPIISRGEALQILKNALRRRALREQAAVLQDASVERRAQIIAQIERDIEKELRVRPATIEPDSLLH
jgi:hypothetical protein